MYKLCKTEQSAARQRKLELRLLEAMGSHPYEQITVSDLCQWMQIPRKSFYRYFSGKDGALHALIDHTLMEFGEGNCKWIGPDHASRIELEALFRFWNGQRPLLDALSRNGLSGVLIERGIYYALEVAGYEVPEEARMAASEETQAAVFVACGLMSMIVQWQRSGYALSAEQLASIATGILTKPLLKTP